MWRKARARLVSLCIRARAELESAFSRQVRGGRYLLGATEPGAQAAARLVQKTVAPGRVAVELKQTCKVQFNRDDLGSFLADSSNSTNHP